MSTFVKDEQTTQHIHAQPVTGGDAHFTGQVASYKHWLTIQTRQHQSQVYHEINEYAERAMKIVEVGNKRIQTFTPFRYKYSALQTITHKQVVFVVALALCWITLMVVNWKITLAWTISLITLGYMSHLVLDVIVAIGAVRNPGEEHIDETMIEALKDADWPPYTILCPLYKEAQVVPQFVKSMRAIDYPADKLQILFLTEEDDVETRKAILSLHLPPHFKVLTVPDGTPRTKPRACNYGLVEATGQYVVIYDAEDAPDPLQLKKAVLTFANHGPELACVQAKLNFYNPQQNLLTRWFTAEYSLWFDLILPGLQKIRLAIPLGGTSNHFPAQTLRALGGWDAFNVTEDCDLGLRLSWFHLKTIVVDSTTYEEANSNVKNWIRQRSRWIKGYMQTYLVHMREPLHYIRYKRLRELFSLQVVVGGKTAILLINPFMWLLFALSMVFRQQVTSAFGALFPAPILFIGVITLFVGNFFYGFIYLLGCMKREQFSLVKWMLLIPVYWFLASVAASMALYELFTRPHYWQKTVHGLHLNPTAETTRSDPEWEELAQLAETLTPLSTQNGPSLSYGSGMASRVQKYEKLEYVPVASVQDSVETMIAPRKPALPPSERAFLEGAKHAKHDKWTLITVLTALCLSIAACVFFYKQGQLLLLHDASVHLNIARAFVNGQPGFNFTQLGGYWLPLPHLAMAPFIWNDFLWRSGLAGSIPSMLGYILASLYVFRAAHALARNSLLSYLGALIFMLNPTILYLQSTPASAMLNIAMLIITCYYLLAWSQSGKPGHLLSTAASICLATLVSYDAWVYFAALLVLVPGIGLVRRQKREQIASNLLIFSILGGSGMLLWVLWCWNQFGDALYFLHARLVTNTQFAQLVVKYHLSTYHDVTQTLLYAGQTALGVLGMALAALATLALLVFFARRFGKPEMFAALMLLAPIVLYLAALYSGQILLIGPATLPINISDRLFQARLGAALVAPTAIFITALAGSLPLRHLFRK
jgi:cellulose synthase/poly-beta-1,6-N-acetylglucosamine synthase-like glycosyltransferase